MNVKGLSRLALPAAIVALGALPAAAQASNASIKKEIKAQDKAVLHSSAYKKVEKELKKKSPATRAELNKLAKECKALKGKIDSAASAVASESASTAKGKTGQKDWVDGVRDIAKGFGDVVTAIKDDENGDKAAAKRELRDFLDEADKGGKLTDKADTDLGLPQGD